MELSFTWSAGLGGEDVPLCKDGAKKRVTDHNKVGGQGGRCEAPPAQGPPG